MNHFLKYITDFTSCENDPHEIPPITFGLQ